MFHKNIPVLFSRGQAVKEEFIYSSTKKTRISFHHRESLKSPTTHRKPGHMLPTLSQTFHNSYS